MERVNVIKDICQELGLTQINNSWIKTLGTYLSIAELPGGDDYEQRVFTAAISNSAPGIGTNIGNSDLTLTSVGSERKLTFGDDTITDQFNIKDINGNSVLIVQGTGQLSLGNSIGISNNTKVELNNTDRIWSLDIKQNVNGGSLTTYGVNVNNFGAVGQTGIVTGVRARAYGNGSTLIGIEGIAGTSTSVANIMRGGSFTATNGLVENIGVIASATGANPIGLIAIASTGGYATRLVDGTQGVGKALLCIQSDGRANWGKVTSTYTTGASGTFSSVDGKVITVTNGLITTIV